MIRKFLICGKDQVFLQSKNTEGYDLGRVIELVLPVREFWKIEEIVRKIHFLTSTFETNADIGIELKKLMKSCARYAVKEEDRIWLYEKVKS